MSRWLVLALLPLLAGCDRASPAPVSAPVVSSPSLSPPPVVLPVTGALLEPGDLGAGYGIERDQPATADPYGLPTLNCPRWHPEGGGSAALFRSGITRTLDAPRGHFDGLTVRRFAGEGAVLAVRELRDQLALCGRDEFREHDVLVVQTFTVLASGFAGPESLLVSERVQRNGVVDNLDHHIVVRGGDLVAYLWLSDQRWTPDQMRPLGVRMATRLCAATRC